MNRASARFAGILRLALVLSLLVLVAALRDAKAQGSAGVRRPRGIYAKVEIDGYIAANPTLTPAELQAGLNALCLSLLDNPAVSGLEVGIYWSTLNPGPPSGSNSYDWSYLDNAFDQVSAWNAQNPSQAPKTVRLSANPGFETPAWALDQIPSCDGLFQSPVQTPASNCGTATFLGYFEGGGGTVLPLPWNAFYKSAYQTFLMALAARYGSNPALVSINVAGPTAASTEILVPYDGLATTPQTQFGVPITPNDMWDKLLAFAYPGQAAYQNSDQAFIDGWNAAIDTFGDIFSGLTLTLWIAGLPDLSNTGFTVPAGFTADCGVPDMDCAAQTTILSYFADPSAGGANAKSTGFAGLNGNVLTGAFNLGAPAARSLSASTAQLASPSAQILAGQEFATAFSSGVLGQILGCTAQFPPDASDKPAGCSIPSTCTTDACIPVTCIPQACLAPGVTQADLAGYSILSDLPARNSLLIPPEQSLYNLLTQYFDGTPAAAAFSGTPGTAPENYLQIYSDDFQYAAANVKTPANVVTGSATVSMTAQALLNLASQKLLEISEPAPAITEVANAEGESPVIAPNTWVEIKGQNLAPVGYTRTWGGSDFVNNQMPTALSGVSATVNGKSAFVYYISPTQVNILTPPDAMSGPVAVQVTTDGSTSASFTAQAQALSPAFFVFNGGPYVAATHLNGSYVGPTTLYPGSTTPAAPGETIVLYAEGFGPVSTPVVSGSALQSGTLSPLPVVKIGDFSANVLFAGLVAPGEFQFNVVAPASLADGDQPITAMYGGLTTQSGTLITVQH